MNQFVICGLGALSSLHPRACHLLLSSPHVTEQQTVHKMSDQLQIKPPVKINHHYITLPLMQLHLRAAFRLHIASKLTLFDTIQNNPND